MSDPKKGTGKKPPNTGRRLYTDEDPSSTVPIKFATVSDVRDTIKRIERLYKKGEITHKRATMVAMVLEQRSRFMKGKKKENELAKKYTEFLKKRTKQAEKDRKKMSF
jgi:DNA-binding transcriptional MerR regulator